MSRAEDETRVRLFGESVRTCPDKCGTDGWRGRFCPYHEGWLDGYDVAVQASDVLAALGEGEARAQT